MRVDRARMAAKPPTLEHAMIAARARVLSNPGVDTLRQWIGEPQGTGFSALPASRRVAVLYAAALANNQLRDPVAARAMAKKLDELARNEPRAERLVRLLNAEIDLAAGEALAVDVAEQMGKHLEEVRLTGAEEAGDPCSWRL